MKSTPATAIRICELGQIGVRNEARGAANGTDATLMNKRAHPNHAANRMGYSSSLLLLLLLGRLLNMHASGAGLSQLQDIRFPLALCGKFQQPFDSGRVDDLASKPPRVSAFSLSSPASAMYRTFHGLANTQDQGRSPAGLLHPSGGVAPDVQIVAANPCSPRAPGCGATLATE